MSLLCKCGLHFYPKEPQHKEFIRSTGFHFFLFSSGIQTGIMRCLRCDKEKYVERSGILGTSDPKSAGRWHTTTKERADRINSAKPF